MRFASILAALPVLASFVYGQQTHTVKVGENGALTFNPTSIQVQNGDVVSFQFLSKNHTVTQSTFASPCTNLTNPDGTAGVDSGFQFVPAGATQFQQFSFTVNNASAPLWFYCRQANHCALGMVFAINPTAEKSFAAFQQKAMGGSASSAGAPPASGSAKPTSSAASPTASPNAPAANGAIRAGSVAGLLLTGVGLVAGVLL